ncbi:uncharacterized protein [Porites lutea]|uniref:uncharacterized protein isoform X3 n=1 Tax=Porites lutea TaxID=51062 RepID=UPI003CC538EE
MPSGFPVHVVALLHVIIYTYVGQTIPQTITAETFGKAQDEQTYVPKRLRSVCFDRCAKEAKVIFKECMQSCQKESTLDQAKGLRKPVTQRTLSLTRRTVPRMTVLNECKMAPNYPAPKQAEGLSVDFETNRTHIKVSWKAIDPSDTGFNWTDYAVIYQVGEKKKASCKVVPKNQTFYMVPQGHFSYPDPFYVSVVTHPYNGDSSVQLSLFTPKVTRATFSPNISGKDPTLYSIPSPAPFRPDNPKEVYYACYYPEGEDFRKQVASIVNYFRQNGYNVIMDVMVSAEITSQGPTRWAEGQIRRAKKVLVFLSPGLVNLALDGRDNTQCQEINRVWFELEVLRDMYTRNRSASKMVCLLLPDTSVSTSELPLWARVSYKWPHDVQEILKRLNDRPMILPL